MIPCDSPTKAANCGQAAEYRIKVGRTVHWHVCEHCRSFFFKGHAAKPLTAEEHIAARDGVIDAVRDDLLRRSQLGIKKYGTTLERKDLNLRDWLQHTYEEHLDAANYLKRAIMEIDSENPSPF
ncbi:hypothetical protein SAMN04515666_11958 [Bosea lupini]|uniref:Uncharacterized protein n=1 Tax=Bosea lupini TaxID=1036779 RepID=A0A1H8AHL2_9HYPH|nr:hypothetical protein [Bosea lupini]SEM70033.1 hypothetical protein SAMN04515666_11958 [Bosea lupini]